MNLSSNVGISIYYCKHGWEPNVAGEKLWLDRGSNSGSFADHANTLPLSYWATWSSYQQLFTLKPTPVTLSNLQYIAFMYGRYLLKGSNSRHELLFWLHYFLPLKLLNQGRQILLTHSGISWVVFPWKYTTIRTKLLYDGFSQNNCTHFFHK